MKKTNVFFFLAVLLLFTAQRFLPFNALILHGNEPTFHKAAHSFTCQLVHGNALHAGVNALAFLAILAGFTWQECRRTVLFGIMAGWMGTFLFSVLWMPSNSTLVGSSGIIFGMLGAMTAQMPSSRWSVLGLGSFPLVALAPVAVAADAFISTAWPVHSLGFLFGAGLGLFTQVAKGKLYEKLENDGGGLCGIFGRGINSNFGGN
jgi:membrane associated rhomboid family serine protease